MSDSCSGSTLTEWSCDGDQPVSETYACPDGCVAGRCVTSGGQPGEQLLASLAPGTWYEIPNSRMSVVDPCPANDCAYSSVVGQPAVMDAWSGGAYDPDRHRLYVWGGGHADYGGNELYAFDVPSLSWSRLSEPSPSITYNGATTPDGNPSSRHTYDYVQYVSAVGMFCSFGGAALYGDGNGGTSRTDCFDFGLGDWVRFENTPSYGIGATSAVDSSTGHAWAHGTGGGNAIAEWDSVANSWTLHGSQYTDGWLDYDHTAAIDPGRGFMVAPGKGSVYVWDISGSGEMPVSVQSTSGPQAVVSENAPGFEYDLVGDRFIGWASGANLYALDVDSWTWSTIVPDASNSVTPSSPVVMGTYGRFRYMPEYDAVIIVNSVDENVYVYKMRR